MAPGEAMMVMLPLIYIIMAAMDTVSITDPFGIAVIGMDGAIRIITTALIGA